MGKSSLAAMLLLPVLAGCTANDPTFGGAVRHNYAIQVIDPEPKHEGALVEGGDGAHAAAAAERYRTGKVKEPKSIRTTQGTGGSGGGSGMSAN